MIPQTGASVAAYEHHLTVPMATDLMFTAYSSAYTITGSGGSAAPNKAQGVPLTINIPSGVSQHKEVLTLH